MASLNKVILIGNMTKDPELRTTQSGISTTSFNIAVQRRFASKQEGQPTADFISIVAWRQTAEFVCKYFNKGNPILVCGAIQTRDFTDKDGNKRYVTEVVADEVGFVESKGAENAAPSNNGASAFASSAPAQFEDVTDDESLPF